MTDDDVRDWWRRWGGKFHGPNVEHGTMEEAKLLPLLRYILTGFEPPEPQYPSAGVGHEQLWGWFSLSRASFCIMPRAFMHAMPDLWQRRMAALMREWDDTWNWGDDIDGCRAQATKGGRLTKMPDYIINYRHPERARIESMKRKPSVPADGSMT